MTKEKQLTKYHIVRLIEYLIKQEDNSIEIEMELIQTSGFPPDVVDRAARLNKYNVTKEAFLRVLRKIKDLQEDYEHR